MNEDTAVIDEVLEILEEHGFSLDLMPENTISSIIIKILDKEVHFED